MNRHNVGVLIGSGMDRPGFEWNRHRVVGLLTGLGVDRPGFQWNWRSVVG